MSFSEELIFIKDNKLNFGNHKLTNKSKKEDFEFRGDLYKVKTYDKITKLEKNSLFLYESEPGSTIYDFEYNDLYLAFIVESYKDLQITLDLEEEKEYMAYINDEYIADLKTNISGKLVLSVTLDETNKAKVKLIKK